MTVRGAICLPRVAKARGVREAFGRGIILSSGNGGLMPRCAAYDPQPSAPRRRSAKVRASPFTRRADHRGPARSASARARQVKGGACSGPATVKCGWHPHRLRKGRHEPPGKPRRACPRPLQAPETQRSSACAAGASADQPTARRSVHSPRPAPSVAAPSPKEPRRAVGTRGTRRDFRNHHGPTPSTPAKVRPVRGWHPHRATLQRLPRAQRTPRKPSPAHLPPAATRARRQSQCTHPTARRAVYLSPHTAALSPRSRAEAQEPRRRTPHL
jgi:hypothetical protein